MSTKCLMIETSEKKRYFAALGAGRHLKEYCRALKAKMFVVKAETPKKNIMSLPKLVVALCDVNHQSDKIDFKILETKKI